MNECVGDENFDARMVVEIFFKFLGSLIGGGDWVYETKFYFLNFLKNTTHHG